MKTALLIFTFLATVGTFYAYQHKEAVAFEQATEDCGEGFEVLDPKQNPDFKLPPELEGFSAEEATICVRKVPKGEQSEQH